MRFPEFTEEWETKKLGEVMYFKVTNSFSRENLNYESGTVKNIHYGDVHTKFQTLFDVTKEMVPFINDEVNVERILDENYCREGDVIFADASEDLNDVGKSIEVINVNGEKVLSGLHTLLARPQNNVFHLGFNGYLFKSSRVRTQIQKESQGSKVLSINTGRISKIELSFPSVNEQERITTLLSLLDERIQTQNKIINDLKTLKSTISKKIFSQDLRFKSDNGNDYPEWESKKLGEVLEIQGGYAFKSSSFNQGNTKVIRIGDIEPRIKLQNFSGVYSHEIPNEKYIVKKNDFVMALSGATFGKVGKILDYGIAYINQRVALFKTEQCIEFFYQLVLIEDFKNYIASIPTASAQPNISNNDITNYRTAIPCIAEQQKIANFLSSIDTKVDTETQLLNKLEKQKKFLLQQMFV